jgi:hypothetical protein
VHGIVANVAMLAVDDYAVEASQSNNLRLSNRWNSLSTPDQPLFHHPDCDTYDKGHQWKFISLELFQQPQSRILNLGSVSAGEVFGNHNGRWYVRGSE